MPTLTRPESGLRIDYPATCQITDAPPTAPARRRVALRTTGPIPLPTPESEADAALVEAFRGQGMEMVDRIELTAGSEIPGSGTTRRGAGGAAQEVSFTLPLGPAEDAVILLEQDGVYAWQFADAVAASGASAPSGAGVHRGPRGVGGREAQFRIVLTGSDVDRTSPREGTRGLIGDLIGDKVKAIVFKFAARLIVGNAIKFLERHVRRGLVDMSEPDPAKWSLLEKPHNLRIPRSRPARVLLFIHGTFSSTIGAYGGLEATPWGQVFMQAARSNYDAIIGFDHVTLSEDPLANAADLLEALQAINWPHPPQFDVVTHSRGGLVLRCLCEHLLPVARFKARFERVVFVAATNGGTLLAEPANWHALVDLYTNLAVGAGRLMGMMPQAKAVTTVVSEIVQGIGALVKYCATTAVTDRRAPGLAAMEPDGEFVRKLNEEQENQPSIAQSYYCAITSEFVPQVTGGDHEPQELPKRLLLGLAGSFMNQLMKEAHDLVVNTASMTRIDPGVGQYVKDRLDFGPNPQVYHTNYFIRPEVVNALTRWLRLTQDVVPVGGNLRVQPAVRSVRSAKAGSPTPLKATSFQASSPPRQGGFGGFSRPDVPAAVDTDILVTHATVPLAEALEQTQAINPSYVVVQRHFKGETLHYAFTAAELWQALDEQRREATLLDALHLRETGRSELRGLLDAMTSPEGGSTEQPSTLRAVVLAGNQPVGVLPEAAPLPNATELVARARSSMDPQKAEDLVVARRSLPSFTAPEGSPGNLPRLGFEVPANSTIKRDVEERRGRLGKADEAPLPAINRTRNRPRAGGAASAGGSRPQAAPKTTCYFRAEMDEEVAVGRPATVEVLISRTVISKVLHAAAAQSQAQVDASRKLLVQVLPKVNFESVDEGWVEVDLPVDDEPLPLYFILRATHVGDGQVWVVIRQGQVPLVTLVLGVKIVKRLGEGRGRALAEEVSPEAPKLMEPLHQLVITELRRGTDVYYRYQLQSPTLQLLRQADSKLLVGDRRQYIANLYKSIEDRWLGSADDVANFTEELKEMGALMFDELIPEDLQQDLWANRKAIQSIMVIAEEPFIPWELVCLKEPGERLSSESLFFGQMGLVRWLYGTWPKEELRIRPGRAHYVIPHYPYPKYVLPEAEEEKKFLEEEFDATDITPSSMAVRRLLAQSGAFDLLHFACHGAAESDNITDAQLWLEGRVEGDNYFPDPLNATTVETRANLKGADGTAPIIVLNACQVGRGGYKLTGIGGFAQAFIRCGAGLFVGTLWSVGDWAARTFTEAFYKQLKAGQTVAAATIAAREAARKAGDATWLAYVVYGHPHAKLAQ